MRKPREGSGGGPHSNCQVTFGTRPCDVPEAPREPRGLTEQHGGQMETTILETRFVVASTKDE